MRDSGLGSVDFWDGGLGEVWAVEERKIVGQGRFCEFEICGQNKLLNSVGLQICELVKILECYDIQ